MARRCHDWLLSGDDVTVTGFVYREDIAMSELAVIAKLVTLPGKRDDVVAVLSAMVDDVKAEVGTEVYALHTQNDDDVTIWFYERYVDKAALGVHGATDAMKALGPKLAGLLAGRPELTMLTPVAAKGV
jgi:quinol monooxygenase YgiN